MTDFSVALRQRDRPRSWAVELLVFPPLVGAALLLIAWKASGSYHGLVKEDGVLEWAQVIAYGSLVATAVFAVPKLWQRDRTAALVVAVLGVLALLSIGEELSWGQRIVGFETPEVAAQNRQGELTLHNDARFEQASRFAFLLAGLYGLLAPFVARRTPLSPPRQLVAFFGVVVAYMGVRLLFLEHPTYSEAKYSEWPELCLAIGAFLWCVTVARGDKLERLGVLGGDAHTAESDAGSGSDART